jgi:hypothetical protein
MEPGSEERYGSMDEVLEMFFMRPAKRDQRHLSVNTSHPFECKTGIMRLVMRDIILRSSSPSLSGITAN